MNWRGDLGWFMPRWRVSYVQATGEVYALELGGRHRLEVLGVVAPDPVEDPAEGNKRYYRTLDQLLEGWADEARGIAWVRERLVSYAGHPDQH